MYLEERTAAYEQYVAELKTPRLHGSVTAMAERAADKALASKAPLQDTALQLHAFLQFTISCYRRVFSIASS